MNNWWGYWGHPLYVLSPCQQEMLIRPNCPGECEARDKVRMYDQMVKRYECQYYYRPCFVEMDVLDYEDICYLSGQLLDEFLGLKVFLLWGKRGQRAVGPAKVTYCYEVKGLKRQSILDFV
jgi:hypothetical protein